jgi:hypothetical protein
VKNLSAKYFVKNSSSRVKHFVPVNFFRICSGRRDNYTKTLHSVCMLYLVYAADCYGLVTLANVTETSSLDFRINAKVPEVSYCRL